MDDKYYNYDNNKIAIGKFDAPLSFPLPVPGLFFSLGNGNLLMCVCGGAAQVVWRSLATFARSSRTRRVTKSGEDVNCTTASFSGSSTLSSSAIRARGAQCNISGQLSCVPASS